MIAADHPDTVQLLTPEGERVHHPQYDLEISADQWRAFYRDLVMVRRFDSEATALQRQGELGLFAPCLGQEAAQVGAGRAMQATDYCFPSYREHGIAWTRGIDMVNLLGLFRGTTAGGWDADAHRFGLYTIVVGNQALHGVGWAMAASYLGTDEAALVCFGDGASSQGDVLESFVFAAASNAPVVFLLQNNQFAISQSTDELSPIPLYRRAEGFGFPGVRVDGNDVAAVYSVVSQAMTRARTGGGPTLIEAYTYRLGAHTTSDDPTRYRLDALTEAWHLRDPIERVRSYLVRNGLADADFFAGIDAESLTLAEHLRRGVRSLPVPEPLSMFDHVYAEPHAQVQREREDMATYLASFVDDPSWGSA